MAPNTKDNDRLTGNSEFEATVDPQAQPREYTIVYPMLLVLLYWHIGGLYGLYLAIMSVKWPTILLSKVSWQKAVVVCRLALTLWPVAPTTFDGLISATRQDFAVYLVGGVGVSVGVHRLWSHRCFKAKLPLQIMLMLFHTLSCQQSIIQWARDHRVHHKYCDTDADPHNATRGFFFSHIGWLLVKKHPDLIRRAKTIDITDLLNNPVLQFQKKHYFVLTGLLVFLLPTVIPVYFWQESWNTAYHVALLRLVITSHITFAINSVAHKFGNKPYDKNISSIQNVSLSLVTFGEGYHNFHHIFPFDYRVSELGNHYFKLSTYLIEFFAWIGWAYDLKYASNDMILSRVNRTGDGTHPSDRVAQGCGDEN